MNWKILKFSQPSGILSHVIHDSLVDETVKDIENRYHTKPISMEPVESVRLDPGGLLKMNVSEIIFNVDGLKVYVNKQHIAFVPHDVEHTARNRAGAIKFNAHNHHFMSCVVLPEFLFGKLLNHMSAMEMAYAEQDFFSEEYADDGQVEVNV